MIHPSETNQPFYRSEKEISSVLAPMTTPQAEKKVEVEKNYFGYSINFALSATWFLVLSIILASQSIDFEWGVESYDRINAIERCILALAALLLGSFHAYILFDNQVMNNMKKDTDLVSKLTFAWPLVLGTLLYFIIACFVFKDYAWDKLANSLNTQNLIIFLLSLSIPVSFCGFFLFGDFSSSIFSPWTVKVESQTVIETEESASECRIVGFICFIGLAALWLLSAGFFGCLLIFDSNEKLVPLLIFSVFFICSVVHFGVLFYTLSTPKYDSGDSSNWIEFLKKNWLIISSCSILAFDALYCIQDCMLQENTSFTFILLSICTVLLMIPSNSSQSFVRHFKPWNSEKKFDQVQV